MREVLSVFYITEEVKEYSLLYHSNILNIPIEQLLYI